MTSWTTALQTSLSFTLSQSLLKLSSQWCHPTISSCRPLLLLPSVFPKVFSNESTLRQIIGASTSASVLPMNIQRWYPLELIGFISLQSKEFSRVFPSTTIWNYQFCSTQPSLWSNFHIQTLTTGKTIALTRQTFVRKVVSLSRFVIVFLPKSKCLLISWLQSPSAVILEPKKRKSVTVSPSICHEVMGLDDMIFIFLNVEL